MLERFLPLDYEYISYKWQIERKQEDNMVQHYGPDESDDMFGESYQPNQEIVVEVCKIVGYENCTTTYFDKIDMAEKEDKDEDVQDHIKENLLDDHKYRDNGGDAHHVKGVQKLSIGNYKVVDDFQQPNFIQKLCKASSQNFEIVVDSKNQKNILLRLMVSDPNLPTGNFVSPYNVGWNNILAEIKVNKYLAFDLTIGKYKDKIVFDEIDMNVIEFTNNNNDEKYILYPLEDNGGLNPYFKDTMSIFTINGFKGSSSTMLEIVDQVVGIIKKLSLQDLENEFRYKIHVRLLPLEILSWRDKQQADVVLHLDKNSRSSSLEVEETDVGEFSAYIKTVMDLQGGNGRTT